MTFNLPSGLKLGSEPLPPIFDGFTDHEYAIKHGVTLTLRVWPGRVPIQPRSIVTETSRTTDGQSKEPASTARASWVLWIHGGAFCSGQHYQPRVWLLPLLLPLDITVVSISHRFAPLVEIEGMLQDCEDAYSWCRRELRSALREKGLEVDLDRWAVGGDSAGGSLATLLALRVEPRPKAVINIYGVTDLLHQQSYYDSLPPPPPWPTSEPRNREEMDELLLNRDPSHAIAISPSAWNIRALDPKHEAREEKGLREMWACGDQFTLDEGVRNQWDLKGYIDQFRLMNSVALDLSPRMSREEQEEKLKRYSIVHLLDPSFKPDAQQRSYPPTFILHGRADMAVPVEESYTLARMIKEKLWRGTKME